MKRRVWSREELAIMRQMYPTWPRTDIQRALPHRSWHSIIAKAHKMRLKRSDIRAFTAAMTKSSRQITVNCEIARTLRAARLAARITARALSEKIGYGPGKVTAWETGRDTPGILPMKDWAESLGFKLTLVPA